MDPLCTEEFVEAYRCTPCLWNTLDPGYRNGLLRRRALASLATRFEMSVDAVRKKIDNLRTYYRRELGKETESLILGTHAYKSHWVHFETLEFLKGHFAKRTSRFSMDSAAAGDCTEAADIADETGELPLGSASPVPFTPPGAADGAVSSALTPAAASDGAVSSASAGPFSDSSLPCPGAERTPITMATTAAAAARRRGVKRCHCASHCWDVVDSKGCFEHLTPAQQSSTPLLPATASSPAVALPAVAEDHLDKFGQHMALMLRKLDMRTQALLLAKFSQLIADHMP